MLRTVLGSVPYKRPCYSCHSHQHHYHPLLPKLAKLLGSYQQFLFGLQVTMYSFNTFLGSLHNTGLDEPKVSSSHSF